MYHPTYQIDLQLLERYAKAGGLDIIDYGCGNGILLDLLPDQRVKSYVGYEVSDKALAVAHQLHRGRHLSFKKIVKDRPPKLGPARSKDVIILVGVLQYLSDDEIEHVIAEASRMLRPGGIFLASCVTDHWFYRLTNMYQFFYPNRYINHQQIVADLQSHGLTVEHQQEKGLVIGPLFSHGLVILFDIVDKIIFRNQGKLGPIGIFIRRVFQPLMMLEYQLPINYGYTLFLVGKK